MTIDQTINKLSNLIADCSATETERLDMMNTLADLIIAIMKRDSNE